jgi:hypothetical protein
LPLRPELLLPPPTYTPEDDWIGNVPNESRKDSASLPEKPGLMVNAKNANPGPSRLGPKLGLHPSVKKALRHKTTTCTRHVGAYIAQKLTRIKNLLLSRGQDATMPHHGGQCKQIRSLAV